MCDSIVAFERASCKQNGIYSNYDEVGGSTPRKFIIDINQSWKLWSVKWNSVWIEAVYKVASKVHSYKISLLPRNHIYAEYVILQEGENFFRNICKKGK